MKHSFLNTVLAFVASLVHLLLWHTGEHAVFLFWLVLGVLALQDIYFELRKLNDYQAR